MYQTKEKKPEKRKPVSGERERTREQAAAAPGYIRDSLDIGRDFPGPIRREPLAYTQEAGRTEKNNGVIQRFGLGLFKNRDTVRDFNDFSKILEKKIRAYISGAELDGDNFYTALERDLYYHPVSELWDGIKEKFSSEENIRILIAKVLALDTTGVENPESPLSVNENYSNYLQNGKIRPTVLRAFESLKEPIEQTLNDIYYWLAQKGAENTTGIILTDSDIHTRGVGVCIVSYRTFSGAGETVVVKPEDKSFEKAVYGKGESLANEFNGILARGGLGEPLRGGAIGTMNIETSAGNAHGSAAEFFEHQKFEEMGEDKKAQIDLKSVESLVAFSSMLGLGDLHVENAVYSDETDENGRYLMQLIDAEIGMKFLLLNRDGVGREIAPLQSAAYFGEMIGARSSLSEAMMAKEHFEGYAPDEIRDFCGIIADRLRGMSSRIVMIPTTNLFSYRKEFFSGNESWKDAYKEDLEKNLYNYFQSEGLKSMCVTVNREKQECINAAESDFMRGRIPYYKLEFGTGKVIHEAASGGIVVAKYAGEGGKGFLDAMIENRLKKLL